MGNKMKIISILITLFIISSTHAFLTEELMQVLSTMRFKLRGPAEPEKKPEEAKPGDAKPGAAGEAGKNGTNGTNGTNQTGAEGTDLIGEKRPNGKVDKAPYTMSDCDQVVYIKGKRIKDWKNYNDRAEAVLTMSAYLINLFETPAQNALLESLHLDCITQLPITLKGTNDTCLIFQDDQNFRNATICPLPTDIPDIINTYKTILICRAGGDLRKLDPSVLKKLINDSCSFKPDVMIAQKSIPKEQIKQALKEELSKRGFDVVDTSPEGMKGKSLKERIQLFVPGTKQADPATQRKQQLKEFQEKFKPPEPDKKEESNNPFA